VNIRANISEQVDVVHSKNNKNIYLVHQDPALRRFTLRRFEVASHTHLTPNLALRRLSFEVAALLLKKKLFT
jgi:hypothetical protein